MRDFSFSLKQLKVIQAIKNEVNIQVTAEKLYLSHSAVISQIKKLEQNIYSKILIRRKNQIYFTSEGELVLDYANKVLELCKEADKAIIYLKKIKKFSLNIGSNKTIAKYISLKLINLFCKRYSYSHVKLQIYPSKSISWGIINGSIDIGIVIDHEIPRYLYNYLSMKPYFKEKTVLILPKSYEHKFTTDISKFNLYKLNMITLKPYFQERKPMKNILKKFNINLKHLNIILELNSIEAIKRAVQDGLGCAFFSNMLVRNDLYSKRFHSISIDMMNANKESILIVTRKNNKSYLFKQFYNYCFAILKTNLYNKFLNLNY